MLRLPHLVMNGLKSATAYLRCRRGTSAVEFALTMPFLATMLVGLSDFGLAANEKMRLEAAVRAGVQAGYANPSDGAAVSRAVRSATGGDGSTITVTSTQSCACADGSAVDCSGTCASGTVRTYLTVTAAKPYTPLFHYPGLNTPPTLTASAELRVK